MYAETFANDVYFGFWWMNENEEGMHAIQETFNLKTVFSSGDQTSRKWIGEKSESIYFSIQQK